MQSLGGLGSSWLRWGKGQDGGREGGQGPSVGGVSHLSGDITADLDSCVMETMAVSQELNSSRNEGT